jgi:hypothetical protein
VNGARALIVAKRNNRLSTFYYCADGSEKFQIKRGFETAHHLLDALEGRFITYPDRFF